MDSHAARLMQRVAAGDVVIGHVVDPENPADFLTKFVDKKKRGKAMRYLTNSDNRVRAQPRGDG